MIHLDANYLILATIPGSPEARRIRDWLARGEDLATSAIAWMEFATGPVSSVVTAAMSQTLEGRILAIRREEAETAADLFNIMGRKRALRYDCLIAATAINADADFATNNRSDYVPFAAHGLRLLT